MKTNEERVLEYIDTHNHDPLYFGTQEFSNKFESIKNSSIEELIICCLNFLRSGCSYRKIDGELVPDTGSCRYRSSIDIWRHIISIRPEVTIFEVMNSIYNIKDKLYGQYCTTVWRRVFKNKPKDLYGDIYPNIENQTMEDEYNLLFSSWKDIGKK